MTVGTPHGTLGDLGYESIEGHGISEQLSDRRVLLAQVVELQHDNVSFSAVHTRMS
jgi:hypothetical protein